MLRPIFFVLALTLLVSAPAKAATSFDVVDRVVRVLAWDAAAGNDPAAVAQVLAQAIGMKTDGVLGADLHALVAARFELLAGTGSAEAVRQARAQLDGVLKTAIYDARLRDGDVAQRFAIDLTGNGRQDRLELVAVGPTEKPVVGRLRVTDDRSQVVWEGPDTRPSPDALPDPLVFPLRPPGKGALQVVGDLGADGTVELVAGVGDGFRVLAWKDMEFVPGREGRLVESPMGSGAFAWRPLGAEAFTWIDGFRTVESDGSAVVDVAQTWEGRVNRGLAIVEPTRDGFRVLKWIVGMK